MSFQDKLNQIESLQQTIQKHGKLADDILKKINYKFRLEWNYNSNKIEGGSLTRRETRTVMIGNITVDGKPIKDVMEMKGHDDVILNVIKMGKGELNISEKRIKEIHSAIIHEEDPEKKRLIGQWKTVSNYLINYKNERFDFVNPADVRDRMHLLINWVNAQKEKITKGDKSAIHPVLLAFQFHLDFVAIHPFFDGNGRTARILTNIILISYGYPPIYIKEEEKERYYQYLGDIQGYGGEPDIFFEFMADLILRSQQIIIDAIEGKSIDEPDDLDKRLVLLEKELEGIDSDEEVKKLLNKEVFFEIFDSWLSELIKTAIPIAQKFNKFFTGINHYVHVFGHGQVSAVFTDENPQVVINNILEQLRQQEHVLNNHEIVVRLFVNYGTLKKGGLKTFGCNFEMAASLHKIKYVVQVDEFTEQGLSKKTLFERLLHKPLTKSEIDIVAQILGDSIFNHIDFYTKQQGLR
jgi:Fic family protein